MPPTMNAGDPNESSIAEVSIISQDSLLKYLPVSKTTIYFLTSDPNFVYYSTLFRSDTARNSYDFPGYIIFTFKLQNGLNGRVIYDLEESHFDPNQITLDIDLMAIDKTDAWKKLLSDHPDLNRTFEQEFRVDPEDTWLRIFKFGEEDFIPPGYGNIFDPLLPMFFRMFNMSQPFTNYINSPLRHEQ